MQSILLFFGQIPKPTVPLDDIIGATVAPPVPGFNNLFGSISTVFVVGIQLFITVAAIAVLIYLFMGAFDWVNSQGEAERLAAAQAKMTHAVVGLILIIAAITIFLVISGPILGIIYQDKEGDWIFKLPHL